MLIFSPIRFSGNSFCTSWLFSCIASSGIGMVYIKSFSLRGHSSYCSPQTCPGCWLEGILTAISTGQLSRWCCCCYRSITEPEFPLLMFISPMTLTICCWNPRLLEVPCCCYYRSKKQRTYILPFSELLKSPQCFLLIYLNKSTISQRLEIVIFMLLA